MNYNLKWIEYYLAMLRTTWRLSSYGSSCCNLFSCNGWIGYKCFIGKPYLVGLPLVLTLCYSNGWIEAEGTIKYRFFRLLLYFDRREKNNLCERHYYRAVGQERAQNLFVVVACLALPQPAKQSEFCFLAGSLVLHFLPSSYRLRAHQC